MTRRRKRRERIKANRERRADPRASRDARDAYACARLLGASRGRVRDWFFKSMTESGRFSSSRPNLQNIPRDAPIRLLNPDAPPPYYEHFRAKT